MDADELEELRATLADLLLHEADPAAALAVLVDEHAAAASNEGYDAGYDDGFADGLAEAAAGEQSAPLRLVEDVVESL